MEVKPRTAEINGRLWGERANDWAAIQEKRCQPVYLAVFDRVGLGPGMTYLDVGCGAGLAAQLAANRGAVVSGLDAAEEFLAIARGRVPGADFYQGDIESLPFPDDQFDLVTGFNSFQYAGNPSAALAEAARVARSGAKVAIVTWGNPEGMDAASLVAALRPLLPAAPPGAPGPFALSDEDALRAFATGVGLCPVEVFDVDCPWRYADLPTALRALGSSGVAVRAMENSSEAALTEANTRALAPFRQSDGSYSVGASFRCLLARA
jgi:SAM-dependent methyltransferase